MQTIKQSIITIIVCVAVVAGVSLVYSWTGPPYGGVCNDPPCPPGGNVPAPINVGSVSQYKSGALSIGGLLQAPQIQLTTGAVAGKVLTSDASGLASWQTGGGASGVSQIIAGTNVTISPTTGIGAVTINSAAGGGGYWALSGANIYNTNTGNVGIGTVSPLLKMQIYDGTRYFNIGSSGTMSGIQIANIGTSVSGTLGTFYSHNYTTGNTEIASTGGFGLYVNGALSRIRSIFINSSGDLIEIGNGGNMVFKGQLFDAGDIIFQNSAGSQKGRIWTDPYGANQLYFSTIDNIPDLTINAAGGIVAAGNVSTNNRADITTINAGSQGINTYDIFAQWTVRANQICLGGGSTGNNFGDCRTVWPGVSDVSLKQNIQTIPNALEKVLQLNGVSFQWKESGKPGIGLVAQDVEKVFPEVVSTNQTSGLKSLEYGNLVGPLVEAIKEQQKQIEELKNEVEKLKQQ